jgi:hypothetical protein
MPTMGAPFRILHLELRQRPVSREHARPQPRPAGSRRHGGGAEVPAPAPVPVGVTGHRTQRPRGQVGPPGPHPAQPSSSLNPGGERRPIPPPLAPLIAQLVHCTAGCWCPPPKKTHPWGSSLGGGEKSRRSVRDWACHRNGATSSWCKCGSSGDGCDWYWYGLLRGACLWLPIDTKLRGCLGWCWGHRRSLDYLRHGNMRIAWLRTVRSSCKGTVSCVEIKCCRTSVWSGGATVAVHIGTANLHVHVVITNHIGSTSGRSSSYKVPLALECASLSGCETGLSKYIN